MMRVTALEKIDMSKYLDAGEAGSRRVKNRPGSPGLGVDMTEYCKNCQRTQEHHLLVTEVDPEEEGKFCVRFDVDIWMTVHRNDIGKNPEPGDVLKVLPPVAVGVKQDASERCAK